MKSFKAGISSKSPIRVSASIENSHQGFTEDEVQELREAFNLFDTEGRGTINPKELRAVMQSLDFETKNPIIYEIVSNMNTGAEGIAFEPFLEILATKLGDRKSKEGIDRIFQLFDYDKSNTIDINDLRRITKEIGENMTQEELKELLNRAASNGLEITEEDFYQIMTKKSFV